MSKEKTITILGVDNKVVGTTYPKRAEGLVKKGRAKWIDDLTIQMLDEEKITLSDSGIHLKSSSGSSVDIDDTGIHTNGSNSSVDINEEKVFSNSVVNDSRARKFKRISKLIVDFVSIAVIVTYILLGCLTKDALFPNGRNAWMVFWVLVFLIPITEGILRTIRKKKAYYFPIPCIVVFVFLFLGMAYDYWHPYWVMFFAIPLYYILVGIVDEFKN